MRKALQYTELIIIGSVLLTLSGCTWNPFGEEEISSGYREISGNVQLNDGSNPDGIYVWLEGFNAGTYTDGTGQFSLTLPQSGSSGLSGVYKLYCYVANYELDYAQVVIQDGEFAYSRGDINKEGKLALSKLCRKYRCDGHPDCYIRFGDCYCSEVDRWISRRCTHQENRIPGRLYP